MANATSLPSSTQMRYFDWKGDPHFTRNPAIDGSGTYTLYWSVAPLDSNDAIITGGFEVTSTAKDGENYTFWVPASAVSADGLSATGCVGGIRPNGLDYTTGDTTFAPTSTTILSGMKITCGIPAVLGELLRAAVQGVIQTGSVSINIGTGSSEDAYIYHNGNPWLKQTSAGVAQYWNGSSYINISDTQSSVTQKVSSTDTTADYLYNKIDVATDGELTKVIGNPAGAETLQLGLATTLTKSEMDSLHTGISANVTGTNLAVLTAGPSSDADSLHSHSSLTIASGIAGEAIDGSTTPIVVAKMANNYKDYVWPAASASNSLYATFTTAVPVGDSDATSRAAMSFVYTDALAATITLEKMIVPFLKTLAPADNYYIDIQTDNAGSPSGTVITNGTSDALAASTCTATSPEVRTMTFSTPPTLTSGTTYWAVLRRSGATDATNYLSTYRSSTDVAGYVSKTYTASTTTWSSALATDMNWSFTFNVDYNGKIVKASNTDMKRGNVVGITKSNVAAGEAITYYGPGAVVTGLGSLTDGADYYAGASGTYTDSPTFTIPGVTPKGSAFLFKIFRAEGSTGVVDLGTKLAMISVGSTNVISAQAVSSDLDFDFPISCGFQPEQVDIYRVAGSTTIAETIKTIRGQRYIDTTAWTTTASTFYSIPTILEHGVVLRVQMDGVDNNSFGGVIVLSKL